MRNRIKNIFNSSVCELSMLVIVCCMIVTNLSLKHYNGWTGIAVAATVIGGVVLFSFLVRATLMLITKKKVKEMPIKSRLIFESISRLLFLYWIYIVAGPIFAIIWAAFMLWDGIRSFKQLAS